jgi:phospholipid transport system substrate-binding protein
MKKVIICLILSFIPQLGYSSSNSNEVVNNYVHQLVKDGLDIVQDNNLSQDAKVAKTKKLILANLNLNWMAKYTIGSYRRTLTPEQINQFTSVYGNYLGKTYSDLVKNYHGQIAKVEKIRVIDKGEFMITMLIGTVKVDYLVKEVSDASSKNALKISDVITEGVSLINSQQSEFVNILSGEGGFTKLIEELRKRS